MHWNAGASEQSDHPKNIFLETVADDSEPDMTARQLRDERLDLIIDAGIRLGLLAIRCWQIL